MKPALQDGYNLHVAPSRTVFLLEIQPGSGLFGADRKIRAGERPNEPPPPPTTVATTLASPRALAQRCAAPITGSCRARAGRAAELAGSSTYRKPVLPVHRAAVVLRPTRRPWGTCRRVDQCHARLLRPGLAARRTCVFPIQLPGPRHPRHCASTLSRTACMGHRRRAHFGLSTRLSVAQASVSSLCRPPVACGRHHHVGADVQKYVQLKRSAVLITSGLFASAVAPPEPISAK